MTTSTKFNFKELRSGQLIPDGMTTDLLQEKITGILIKDFLTETEVQRLLQGFWSIPDSKKTKVDDGFTSYPMSFAQFTQMKAADQISVHDYVAIAQDLLNNQEAWFGLNVVKRLCDFLESQQEFESVSPIFNSELNKPMVPFNIRELYPKKGKLTVHCENLFFDEFPEFFSWLKLMNIRDNKLSYFITLQEAESGGELCCFDLNWKTVKERKDKNVVVDIEGNSIDIETSNSVHRQLVRPSSGDLLLFAGGNVWHRVETVHGDKSRVTLGGFVAETTTPGKYYIWS